MSRRGKFVAGGVVIVAAIAYLIWSGVSQSVVYFVTPSELLAAPVPSKTYRLGGLVQPGSLKWEPKSLDLTFQRISSFGALCEVEGDVSAAAGELQRDRTANPARGPGDDCSTPAKWF